MDKSIVTKTFIVTEVKKTVPARDYDWDKMEQENKELSAAPSPKEESIIQGGVEFIMGPGGDDGTRMVRDEFPKEES